MLILLFFDGYDLRALDYKGGKILSCLHCEMRTVKRNMTGQQPYTGYYTAFKSLVKALRKDGHDVKINDFKAAQQRPDYPIGLLGFTSVLEKTKKLKNPVLFGSGSFGDPAFLSKSFADDRFKMFLIKSDWQNKLFRLHLKRDSRTFFTGIDTQKWPDLSKQNKKYDFLIYDKMYYETEDTRSEILSRIIKRLKNNGKTYATLKYAAHTPRAYRKMLSASKNLIWLSAHETQGMAYQEAMACGLPVLAWDEGQLKDPEWKNLAPRDFTPSSVPYFDNRCGERFTLDNFEQIYEVFLKRNAAYKPRDYVMEELTEKKSTDIYLSSYSSLIT